MSKIFIMFIAFILIYLLVHSVVNQLKQISGISIQWRCSKRISM